MNGKNNLIYVKSPFQFICALEAIDKFSLKNITLISILYGSESGKMQQKELIEEYKILFERIIQWEFVKPSCFAKHIDCIRYIKNKQYDFYFTGDTGVFNDIVISNISVNNIFLIDDGVSSVLIYESLKSNHVKKKQIFKKFRYSIFGLKTSHNKSINLFTFLKLNPLKNIYIVKNNFKFLTRVCKIQDKRVKKEVYILGSGLVESGIIDRDIKDKYINTIIKKYNNYDIYYLKHRAETEYVNNNFDKQIHVINSTKPGEIYFFGMDYIPEVIIGTLTTMLVSLKEIFSETNIISYRIHDSHIKTNIKEINQVYRYFQDNGITVEDCNFE